MVLELGQDGENNMPRRKGSVRKEVKSPVRKIKLYKPKGIYSELRALPKRKKKKNPTALDRLMDYADGIKRKEK